MKREIKFRGWMPKEKAMLYEISVADKPITNLDLFFKQTADDGFVWMQYTGLLDKNGKEIFEGDIVEYDYDDKHDPYGNNYPTNKKERCKVEMEDFNFGLELPLGTTEIIGNIYEHTGLLN